MVDAVLVDIITETAADCSSGARDDIRRRVET